VKVVLHITPRDPLVVRDGRPFSPEGVNRAYSVRWPYPSVSAGAVRSLLGTLAATGTFVDAGFRQRLLNIEVRGPLPTVKASVYFPVPADLLVCASASGRPQEEEKEFMALRLQPAPLLDGEGCDLPHAGLWPAVPAVSGKAVTPPEFWSARRMEAWLLAEPDKVLLHRDDPEVLWRIEREERFHVQVDALQGTVVEDAGLFVTQGLSFAMYQGMTVAMELGDRELERALADLPRFFPMGGERRLAGFAVADARLHDAWRPPSSLGDVLAGKRHVRMCLATPALFDGGWCPGWLSRDTLEGKPPGVDRVNLRLRGACVPRWRAISGWDLAERGPKPARRLVPAGAVYFFEVLAGDASALAQQLWLQPVSDGERDRSDGFGLAMWGVWSPTMRREER